MTAPNDLEAFWLPFTSNRAFKKRPRLVSGAKDMHYFTPDGRVLLDGTSGLWCCNAGHNRAPIAEAIAAQARALDVPPIHASHEKAFVLANRIAAMSPADLNHVFFCNSGSEAVDTALKVALTYHALRGDSRRTRFVSRERGYHGAGFGGTSLGGVGIYRKLIGPLMPGVDFLPATYDRANHAFTRGEPETGAHFADELERIVGIHDASTIAAVIIEPVAGASVLAPPKGYLQRLRAICDKYGILLIFDEVITGFGRLGHTFAADRYGVVPDLIAFAKGITSATVPLGGVIVPARIHDVFMTGPEHVTEFAHGYTYSGHPLAAAAGLATLDLYRDEGLFERARALEPLVADAAMSLRGLPNVLDIRAVGMSAAVDLASRPDAPGRRGFDALEHGFFVENLTIRALGDSLGVAPALIATEDQIGEIFDKLARVIKAVA